MILPKHKDQFVAYDPLVNVLSEFCHQRQCMNEVIDVIVSTTINVDSMYDGIDLICVSQELNLRISIFKPLKIH